MADVAKTVAAERVFLASFQHVPFKGIPAAFKVLLGESRTQAFTSTDCCSFVVFFVRLPVWETKSLKHEQLKLMKNKALAFWTRSLSRLATFLSSRARDRLED